MRWPPRSSARRWALPRLPGRRPARSPALGAPCCDLRVRMARIRREPARPGCARGARRARATRSRAAGRPRPVRRSGRRAGPGIRFRTGGRWPAWPRQRHHDRARCFPHPAIVPLSQPVRHYRDSPDHQLNPSRPELAAAPRPAKARNPPLPGHPHLSGKSAAGPLGLMVPAGSSGPARSSPGHRNLCRTNRGSCPRPHDPPPGSPLNGDYAGLVLNIAAMKGGNSGLFGFSVGNGSRTIAVAHMA